MTRSQGESPSSEPARRFAALVAALADAVLSSPGQLSTERRAAFVGEPLEGVPGAFAEKVRRHAYRVTEDDLMRCGDRAWTRMPSSN